MKGINISTDKQKIDIEYVHNCLKTSYWSKDIPLNIVKQGILNSLCFGVYCESIQIGFARVITDYATFAYLADVFVDKKERGQGIGKKLISYIMNHDQLQGIKRWHLVTKDAQNFYKEFGFKEVIDPSQHMEIKINDVYSSE